MRSATTILGIIHERGKQRLPLERVSRLLFNRDLYLMAYGKIYRNNGATTPGSTPETVDEMSLQKIDTIIEALRSERYRWAPTRRVYIEKKNSTKKRPLSMPTWSDKLFQEVIRLILESYFEPTFSNFSHGFRPGRGCHTALRQIDDNWHGVNWFIEGDIQACFDSLSHEFLMQALAEHIHDGRFLRLIRELLRAGYLEEWRYNATVSGAPQGGIVSPILSNIYLSKFDDYVENTLIPMYTKGARRKKNHEYDNLLCQGYRLRKRGQYTQAIKARKAAQRLPSVDLYDPDYRRLKFVRYADDWLLGLTGTKKEAEDIKEQMKTFLREELKLELSDEKTLITHARTKAARFLSYHISASQDDTRQTKKKRSSNGHIRLRVPPDLLQKKCQKYQRNNKPVHRKELSNNTEYSIVAQYQSEFRGFAEYYQLANDLHRLNSLKWIMEQSLAKTLATKLKTTVKKVHKKYGATWTGDGKLYRGLQVIVPREGKKPLTAKWGGISLKRKLHAILNDHPQPFWPNRSELEKRLLADACELCGSTDRVEVHHIRALKDLEQKGRREKPLWAKVMSARKRKTLVVCWSCHRNIHAGRSVTMLQT
ncbi:reverse transcriptase/maturase family protein [Ktedonobacter robiniae]|uniref:reverse transcriptase/maturase family protein n=1 Tax=Ktedonobacter robiniae TaxID=2778365 RepID=UPI001915442A|nr:reverse transcriptase/maturase family protein [Ktedonobacter robiniae]